MNDTTTALIVFRDPLWNHRAIFLVREGDRWRVDAQGYERRFS